MSLVGFTYWQDEDIWIGYLDDYPDYLTQGVSFQELKENLSDLHQEFSSGAVPHVRRHAELELA